MAALSQMLMGSYGGAPIDATIVHTADPTDSVDRTNYTFSGVAIGTAATNRRIIVGVGNRFTSGNPTISSLTVAGIPATQVAHVSAGASTVKATLFIADVPTGTTADIVVNQSGGTVNCGLGVWAAYDLLSSTATDFGTSVANPATDGIAVSAGGIIVGYAVTGGSDAPRTHTWTGISEEFDETIEGFIAHTGASGEFASASTPTLTVTPSAALALGPAAVFASFR